MAEMDTYKGITPTLVVDTRDLQNTTPVAGTKWRRGSDGKFTATTGNEGTCATLVSFWLSQRVAGTMVTDISQFPSKFTISIAQSGYEAEGGQIGTRPALLDRFGVMVNSEREKKRKWYMWSSKRLDESFATFASKPGYYYLSIQGDGGHALGIVTQGTVQFFDPNEGIMTLNSAQDLKVWTPRYITHDYPDLLKELTYYGVG